MIETVLSVLGVLAGWFGALLIGYSVGKDKRSPIEKIKLKDKSEIHIWKGFMDPTKVYIAHNTGKDGDFLNGDGVVFDEEGHIIQVYASKE